MRTAALLVAAALAVSAVGTAAQGGTKGQKLRGYTFVSDVTPYLGVSGDVCAIKKVLNSKDPDYDAATKLYKSGGSGGPTLQSLAADKTPGGAYWTLSQKHYQDPTWIDSIVSGALAGSSPFTSNVLRVQTVAKNLESNLQVAVAMRYLDKAVELARAKKVDAASGAPHFVDRAWAIFAGGTPACSLWNVSVKRGGAFGTLADCDTSQAAAKILQAMVDAQRAAAKGDADALAAARNVVQAQLAAVYMQGSIAYAHEMYLNKVSKSEDLTIPPESASEDQIQAYSFFRVIAPLVYRVNETAGSALNFWLYPGQPVADDVDLKAARAFAAAYKGMGVTPAMVGKYTDGKSLPGQAGCADGGGSGRRLAAVAAARAAGGGGGGAGRRLLGWLWRRAQ